MKVMVKDKLLVNVDYYIPTEPTNNSGANGLNSLLTLLGNLLNTPNAPIVFQGHGTTVTTQLNTQTGPLSISNMLSPQSPITPSTLPKAYLNILFFDEQMKFVKQNSQLIQVSAVGSKQSLQVLNIEAPQNGYAFIYVNNESNNNVYFDNFQVSHVRGPVLEESHYYPFGSKMVGICSQAFPGVQNSLGFQGKQLDDEFDIDWYDFEARTYDPQIGRFNQIDPKQQFASGYTGMGNNWINGTDPDGQVFWFIAAALVGGFVSGMQSDMHGGSFLGGFARGAIPAAVGGALGGALAGSFANFGLVGGGIAEGAITGFFSGGLTSAMNGGDFLSGGINGAMWGGAIGGVTGLIQRISLTHHEIPIEKGSTYNGDYYASNDELHADLNKKIGNVTKIESDIKTDIRLANKNNISGEYTLEDHFLHNSKGITVGGLTEPVNGWFTSLDSKIILSPGLKGLYNNGINLVQMPVSHEIIHAYHNFKHLNMESASTEMAANAYSLAYAKYYGMTSIIPLHRSLIGSYEASYSWRNVIKAFPYLNFGIK